MPIQTEKEGLKRQGVCWEGVGGGDLEEFKKN